MQSRVCFAFAIRFAFVAVVAACGPDITPGTGVLPGGDSAVPVDQSVVTVEDMTPEVHDLSGGCGLRTCKSAGANCGPIGDGCGGTLDCGTCPSTQTCGGGGTPSVCGGMTCKPRTCASANVDCGPLADGCGGLLQCGNCPNGQACGVGGKPNVCAVMPMNGPPPCVPKSCSMLGFNCGPAGDTCGAMLDCGPCPAGQACGVGGVPSVCGAISLCKPLTCLTEGFNCGKAGDGCGNIIDCGTCGNGDICGGAGKPNVCGTNVPPMQCLNLCQQQMACNGGNKTSISGKVYAPTNPANGYGNPDPLYNALVYVPNAAIDPFPAGVACTQCNSEASGSPLVSTTSGPDGKFVLTNAPCGNNIPIVIQMGRWRRKVVIPFIACCQDNVLTPDQSRLPRNKSEGDIPLIAVVTGSADPIECVLPKIGIDASEFTNPGGGGRVNLYWSDSSSLLKFGDFSSAGALIDNNTPPGSSLWNNSGQLGKYDVVIFDCEGLPYPTAKTSGLTNVLNYANAGGRVFASHYSWAWLWSTFPFSTTATWDTTQKWSSPLRNPANNFPYDTQAFRALIDQSFPKGIAFATWLSVVGASIGPGVIPVYAVRHDFDAVIAPTQRWFYDDPNDPIAANWAGIPLEFTFNTPVGAQASSQCGRVLFSDFHVNTGGGQTYYFPSECGNPAPMTAQEKALEFMLFDLTSCIQPDKPPPPPTCTPRNCAQQSAGCGMVGDGCGAAIDCGPCPAGQVCGGGGVPNQCGGAMCAATTCSAQGISCGPAGDGCGKPLDCGPCPAGQVCGGGGPGKCGAVDGGGCTPITCAQQNLSCGPAGDGCGKAIDCGKCPTGQTCGGGGVPGKCGAPMCTPLTCNDVGANCGIIGDGCGKAVDCGPCPVGQTCGGAGVPNRCAVIM